MTNKTQIQTKKISFVLTLFVIFYAAIDTYLFTYHEINTMKVTTPIILGLVVTILLCSLLNRFFYVWLTRNPIHFSFGEQSSFTSESGNAIEVIYSDDRLPTQQSNDSLAHSFSLRYQLKQDSLDSAYTKDYFPDNYDAILEKIKKEEAERQAEIMQAIREYVTLKTAPYLSKEAFATLISNIEYMACGRPDLYKPLRSNMDSPLRSPGLRHLAWNIGERLGVSLPDRAVFIQTSFPHELKNATIQYLQHNLRDNIPSQIPIDVPDPGDYRFHLDTNNDKSQ